MRVRGLWRGRSGATAVEFGIVGGVFVMLILLTMETCWQLVIAAALDYGTHVASRFGITGAAAPANMSPPPPSRAAAIQALVIQSSGNLLSPTRLAISENDYASFAAVGGTAPPAGTGPGSGGQVVQYTLSYNQPFLTPLPAALLGQAGITHQTTLTVLNEPFPTQ